MNSYHTCKCGWEIEIDVDTRNHTMEAPTECPSCGIRFSKSKQNEIYGNALDDALYSQPDQTVEEMLQAHKNKVCVLNRLLKFQLDCFEREFIEEEEARAKRIVALIEKHLL